ncbi:hypothetical protein HK098_002118 [Nowakowskiella sp. JEL0407]|nr:hypothetical protein HK098_002118 [Nowakowskiella sp. JEL0407]
MELLLAELLDALDLVVVLKTHKDTDRKELTSESSRNSTILSEKFKDGDARDELFNKVSLFCLKAQKEQRKIQTEKLLKRKREEFEESGNAAENPDNYSSKQDMDIEIESFIETRRKKIDQSNRLEFLKQKDNDEPTCSRVDARELNRKVQMRTEVVHNSDGPLARSTKRESPSTAPTLGKIGTFGSGRVSGEMITGISERVKNIETHLNLPNKKSNTSSIPKELYQRVKRIEDHIMKIEELYPPWASIYYSNKNE